MALVQRFFVQVNGSAPDGLDRDKGESDAFPTFDAANEAAVKLVADGADKDAVRVIQGYAFDHSHDIEPTPDTPSE